MGGVTNREAGVRVARLQVFKNGKGTIYSEDRGTHYVVFSYGSHWPLYIFDRNSNKWFGNASKYSVTTSRHASQVHPGGDITWLDVGEMKKLAYEGVVALISRKMSHAAGQAAY